MIVGIDPARDWAPALAWAADDARRRKVPLRLVTALPAPRERHRPSGSREPASASVARSRARKRLDEAAAWAVQRHSVLSVATDVLEGVPSAVLCGLSRQAGLIVLGSRHLGRGEAILSMSSLVVPVTAEADCPVAVVGGPEHVTQERPFLVVGVDGSTDSARAIGWAFEEASVRGCAVQAVAARSQSPRHPVRGATEGPRDTRRILAETLAGWSARYPEVAVSREVVSGRPETALTTAGEHALAVVVGRHGSGGRTGMRLGPVVRGLLRTATCPVVTVPGA